MIKLEDIQSFSATVDLGDDKRKRRKRKPKAKKPKRPKKRW